MTDRRWITRDELILRERAAGDLAAACASFGIAIVDWVSTSAVDWAGFAFAGLVWCVCYLYRISKLAKEFPDEQSC